MLKSNELPADTIARLGNNPSEFMPRIKKMPLAVTKYNRIVFVMITPEAYDNLVNRTAFHYDAAVVQMIEQIEAELETLQKAVEEILLPDGAEALLLTMKMQEQWQTILAFAKRLTDPNIPYHQALQRSKEWLLYGETSQENDGDADDDE